jgi:mono/diheme cytochrome c family protein
MKRKAGLILFSVVLVVFSWYVTGIIQCAEHAVFAEETDIGRGTARERQLEMGRKLFVTRCARCHNERGDKPLSGGPPLSERELTREVIVRNVSGRLRKATKEERRAVADYIESFMKD